MVHKPQRGERGWTAGRLSGPKGTALSFRGALGEDASMHPAVVGLPLEEKGLVLAALLARLPAETLRSRLPGAAGERCAEAVQALQAEAKPVRASAMAALMALFRAPIPAGLEHVHDDWLRERLTAETKAVVDAATAEMAPVLRRLRDEVLSERREQPDAPGPLAAAGVMALRRAVFAGMVPLRGPGAPAGELARSLIDLPTPALLEAIDRRGVETLGVSLRGAPGPVLARAAVGLDGPLGEALLACTAIDGTSAAREEARAIVAAAVGTRPGDRVRDIGLRALALALTAEGAAATVAVAQRLPATLGRRLLEAANLAGAL
jgi:hypothetical protein